MPLPTCLCVAGLPVEEKLNAIYCALDAIVNGSAAVNVQNIVGISDFWKSALGETPAAGQVFGTDGAGVFATFDISDTGASLLNVSTALEDDSMIFLDSGNGVTIRNPGDSAQFLLVDITAGITQTQTPVGSVQVVNGVVVALS